MIETIKQHILTTIPNTIWEPHSQQQWYLKHHNLYLGMLTNNTNTIPTKNTPITPSQHSTSQTQTYSKNYKN